MTTSTAYILFIYLVKIKVKVTHKSNQLSVLYHLLLCIHSVIFSIMFLLATVSSSKASCQTICFPVVDPVVIYIYMEANFQYSSHPKGNKLSFSLKSLIFKMEASND